MTAKTYFQLWQQVPELLKKHKQPRTVSPLWTALVKHQGEKMNEEDEAFEQLALKQGQWEHTSGWRKRQVEEAKAVAWHYPGGSPDQCTTNKDFAEKGDHPWTPMHYRNDTLEEVAKELETKFTGPFGRDTVKSFTAFIRSMKR